MYTSVQKAVVVFQQQSFEGEVSQIDGPTPRNAHGFKVTQQKLQDAKALHKVNKIFFIFVFLCSCTFTHM